MNHLDRHGLLPASADRPPAGHLDRHGLLPASADRPPAGHLDPEKLYAIPLGGLGEIGKNMMLLQYGEEILVLDAGFMFPTQEMFGVDFVLPDWGYLIERKDRVKGILLTHGHEDHVGALPYLLPHVKAPVFGTRLTLGLVKAKLREFNLHNSTDFREITPDDTLDIGPFQVRFVRNVHSIPDGVGLAITTPVGLVVHSGDFKFDQTPIDGIQVDFKKLASLSREQPLLLFSDSTYADRPGYSLPEKMVREALHQIFREAPGRIIITTFASSLPRIQQIVEVTALHRRKLLLIGRSLVNNIRIAEELGYLSIPPGMEIRVEELGNYSQDQIAILTTGSQGEPMSALSLMATRNHKWVEIVKGDTVVFSATPVPGNEGIVLRNINLLFRLGAHVIYSMSSKADPTSSFSYQVHVAGHAHQEELKLLLNLIKPRFFVPVHGEYRHLVYHARLAEEVGIPPDHVLVASNGDILEFSRESARIAGQLPLSSLYVDGAGSPWGAGEIGRGILKERHNLAQEGIVVVCAAVEKNGGKLLDGPHLISKGFVQEPDGEALLSDARTELLILFRPETSRNGALPGAMKDRLSRFFLERTKRKPVIIPIITEV